MGISLAPDPTAAGPTADPSLPKPKPAIGLAPGAGPAPTGAAAPLPTEYPSVASTTGTPQNRLQLATSAFDTFAKSTAPQYTADLREATHAAAGKGQIGSGGLRTTYGNLANQRALALDTEQSNLINSATTATIGDQQAADANALGRYNADTSRLGTIGSLDVAKGTLGLETQKAATSADQSQQQIDLAKKTADINAAYQAGTLTLAQKNQQLAELQNTQQYGLAGEQLNLAKTGQAADIANQQAQLGLATQHEATSAEQTQQQIDLAKKQTDIDAQYKAGTLTLAQRNQALAELAQAQGHDLAATGQAADIANQQGQLQLAKDQLAQSGAQFGLSLAQQKELATLADKTANRQLDISSAQGQASLALELARIMGAKDTNALDPTFLQAITKALGITTSTSGSTIFSGPHAGPAPDAPLPNDTPSGNGGTPSSPVSVT